MLTYLLNETDSQSKPWTQSYLDQLLGTPFNKISSNSVIPILSDKVYLGKEAKHSFNSIKSAA